MAEHGWFHFITPNGREDAWRFVARERLTGERSELLINHVNYFDPIGLKSFLERSGFRSVEYYLYGLKPRFKGAGWKVSDRTAAPPSGRTRVADISEPEQTLPLYPSSLVIPKIPAMTTRLFEWHCRMKDGRRLRLPPEEGIGHEIFGLFRKG
jgi:hypothetical protein